MKWDEILKQIMVIKWDEILKQSIDIVVVFCTIGTFILAYKAYKKFLFQQAKQKQLETLCELIKEIHSNYQLCSFEDTKQTRYLTLIDIADTDIFDQYEELYFFTKDIHDFQDKEKIVLRWDFFYKYYSHPLIPKAIAEKIKPFNNSNSKSKQYCDIQNKKSIIIGNKGTIHQDSSCLFYTEGGLVDCKKFKLCCKELKTEITKWFENYGIKDLNVTMSHHSKQST